MRDIVMVLTLVFVTLGGLAVEHQRYDVAPKNLAFEPSKPHVGDRLSIHFEVENLTDDDIPGDLVETNLYLDGIRIMFSTGYPFYLGAHKVATHSVDAEYMDPLTRAGQHKYRLAVRLKSGAVDADTTNNVLEGILNVLE
jgi:hypothetical protein